METQKIYIGKATRLKERALQHINNLFSNRDNNRNLQEEFSEGANKYYLGCLHQLSNTKYLDEWESIFYLATIELFGQEKVYNKVKLTNEKNQVERIEKAKDVVKKALVRKTQGKKKFTKTCCLKIKDWIEKDDVEKLGLKTKSIKQLFENAEINFLLFGKAGDYIGDKMPQTIYEILKEKVNDLKHNEYEVTKRCLWATSGPKLDDFLEFQSLYKKKYGEKKKLYVLFKLTINAYSQSKERSHYFWKKDGVKYTDTAPIAKTVKALVLNNFYVVKEDFEFEQLQKMYYRYSPRPTYDKRENKYVLNSDNTARQTLYPAILKTLILDKTNEDIRVALGFSEDCSYLMKELKDNLSDQKIDFYTCNEEEQPFYYILAEVEDYVKLQKDVLR